MAPRTSREALIAEMLGDIDVLLTRCEGFSVNVDALQAQMASSTATLDAAGERYRATIVTFTEQAKQKLVSHLERKAGEAGTKLQESQSAEVREAVRRILEEAADDAAAQTRRPLWPRLAELVSVGLVAGLSAAGLVYWLMR
jgi:hypothetical protein